MLLLAVLATGTASTAPEGETQSHETCINSVKFVYTASDNHRLDWGGYVDCSPGINFIYMSAELFLRQANTSWTILDWDTKTCSTYSCAIEETLHYVPNGSYKIKVCFEARSPTSDFPWVCDTSRIYTIP